MSKLLTALLFLPFLIYAESKPQTFSIWKDDKAPLDLEKFETAKVKLTVHIPEKNSGIAIVICPGGGYGGLVTGGEGHGIAKWLNKHGIVGAVLEYRLPRGRKFVPILDAQRAIRFVRNNSEKFGVNKGKVGIIGFSAGGHLASTALTHTYKCPTGDTVSSESCRPDFGILVYPVISMGKLGHKGSQNNLLGKNASAEDIKAFSNELQINSKTPPAFLTHALDDRVVVPENSQIFHENLKKAGVETVYVELPGGGHGLNGYKGPHWDKWQLESMKWVKKLFKE